MEHLLHRNFLTLSGGEKQQVSLAVLLAMDSQIILLDEPFAFCRSSSTQTLDSFTSRFDKMGKTVILCDHDRSLYADYVDCLVELKNGKLFKQDVALLKRLLKLSVGMRTYSAKPFLQLQHVSMPI